MDLKVCISKIDTKIKANTFVGTQEFIHIIIGQKFYYSESIVFKNSLILYDASLKYGAHLEYNEFVKIFHVDKKEIREIAIDAILRN